MNLVMSAEEARNITVSARNKELLNQINIKIQGAAEQGLRFVDIYEPIKENEWSYLTDQGYNLSNLSDRDGILIRVLW